jgi:hypothetical protein
MANDDIKILVVDDDPLNLVCAETNLDRFIGYNNYGSADDGTSGLEYLEKNPDVDIIFLDRMMKKLNGIPMLKKMKENPGYNDIAVIFQTGDVGKPEKQECIDTGSLYILQKPYTDIEQGVMVNVVAAQVRAKRRMKQNIQGKTVGNASFTFKTLDEAENVAIQLALHYPNPLAVYEAIYELLVNAVEHGNLDIGYHEKNTKLRNGIYNDFLKNRQAAPEYKDKNVTASIQKHDQVLELHIKDMGKGFEKADYRDFGTETLREPNGRGIYKAMQVFEEVVYVNGGMEVVCTTIL